jgi:hypothetical protein
MDKTGTSALEHTVTIVEFHPQSDSGRSDFSAMCMSCLWTGLSRDNPERAEVDAQIHAHSQRRLAGPADDGPL